jgi:hypothetical protein
MHSSQAGGIRNGRNAQFIIAALRHQGRVQLHETPSLGVPRPISASQEADSAMESRRWHRMTE